MSKIVLIIVVVVIVLILYYLISGSKKNKGKQLDSDMNKISESLEKFEKDLESATADQMSKSGIYIVEKDKLTPLLELPGNGSINDIQKMLNYSDDELHLITSHKLELAQFILIRKDTLKPVFFGIKDKTKKPFLKELENDIKRLDMIAEQRLF